MTKETPPKQKRGFSRMDPEQQLAIARYGGSKVPGDKRSFSVNRELARAAGRKGGLASRGGGRPPGDSKP